MKETKTFKESELWIAHPIGKYVRNGREYIKAEWVKSDEDVNLGSIKKPNKNIVHFKYKIHPKDNFFNKFFSS